MALLGGQSFVLPLGPSAAQPLERCGLGFEAGWGGLGFRSAWGRRRGLGEGVLVGASPWARRWAVGASGD